MSNALGKGALLAYPGDKHIPPYAMECPGNGVVSLARVHARNAWNLGWNNLRGFFFFSLCLPGPDGEALWKFPNSLI